MRRCLGYGLLAVWSALASADSPKAAADYFVKDLPGLPKDSPEIKMHAG